MSLCGNLSKEDLNWTDWGHLRTGDRVTVWESRRFHFDATVDVLTEDSSVIWVLADSGAGRRAFGCNEDVNISRVSGNN
jgi:hypothetical protein